METAVEFFCPGEKAGISRAVHLGRLAQFYARCRSCPYRDDLGSLSARRIERLSAIWQSAAAKPFFHAEGAGGDSLNEFSPAVARKIATAFGIWLRDQRARAEESPDPPAAVLGGDGSPLCPELVAAVAEGLRWTGCRVVDVGQVTAACLTLALHHLGADGGILTGRGEGVGAVGLKLWHGPSPLSAGKAMDEIRRIFESGIDRPTRRYGAIRRFQAESEYLDELRDHYHALRPLGVVLDTECRPLLAYLGKLTSRVACRLLPCRTTPQRLGGLIRDEGAHLGLRVDADGECCKAWDESGRAVPAERLLALLARHLLAGQGGQAVVLEEGWSESPADALGAWGCRVVRSDPRRAEMDRQVRQHRAILGGDRSDRIWYYRPDGYAAADALRTVTLLLEILSQSDRPLSEVLDAARPAR
jgi:phosphomannomutase